MAKRAPSEGFSGMAELIRGLQSLGETVHQETAEIVQNTAEILAATVPSLYPSRTGTLRDRVELLKFSRAGAAGLPGALRWKVRTKAPHAHLYEYGTVQRFTAGRGANRGTMPATPVFIPAAIRARRNMRHALRALLERQTVDGMTGTMEVRER